MASGSISKIDDLLRNHYYWALSSALEVEEKHQIWTLVEDYPLVPANKRMQVRPISKLAPDINEYVQMMKNGDKFPPVIVTRDGMLVDGNTRTEAAMKLGWHTFPALVLEHVVYAGLSPTSPVHDTLIQLGAGANRKHGRRQSNADLEVLIKQLQPRVTIAEVVSGFHVSKGFATRTWNAAKAERYAVSLGVPLDNEFSSSQLSLFAGKIEKYGDPVWKKTFELAQDAHLKHDATSALMQGLEQYKGETERLAYLAREREQHASVIESGVHVPLQKPRRMKQALGVINKDDAPEMYVEKDPRKKVRLDYRQSIMDAMERLPKILLQQEEWDYTVDGTQE